MSGEQDRAPAFGTALSSADADQAASRLAPDGLQSTGAEMLHRFVVDSSNFGFGEKREPWEYVTAYRNDMIADGWDAEPTYSNHEPLESAARLKREGFVCQILTRDKGPNEEREPRSRGLKRYETKISIWGPDGLAIKPPFPYSFDACVAATTHCGACGASGVPTERVGFAGRVCAACLPEARRRIETPGWCD